MVGGRRAIHCQLVCSGIRPFSCDQSHIGASFEPVLLKGLSLAFPDRNEPISIVIGLLKPVN